MWNFDPGGLEATSNDLPLMSNINDIRVKHYLLDLTVNLNDKLFTGSTTVFLEQSDSARTKHGRAGPIPEEHPALSLTENQSTSVEEHFSTTKRREVVSFPPEQCIASTSSPSPSITCNKIKDEDFTGINGEMILEKSMSHPANEVDMNMPVPQVDNALQEFSSPVNCCKRVKLEIENCEKSTADSLEDAVLFRTKAQVIVSDSCLPFTSVDDEDQNGIQGQVQNRVFDESLGLFVEKRDNDKVQEEIHIHSKSQHDVTKVTFSKTSHQENKEFVMVLDCCDIDVQAVEEIILAKSKFTFQEFNLGGELSKPSTGSTDQCLESEHVSHTQANQKSSEESIVPNGTAGKSLPENLCFQQGEYQIRRERFLLCRKMERVPLEFKVEPWCLKIWKKGVTSPADFPAAVCIHYRTQPAGRSLTWAGDQDGSPCVFTQGAWINNRSLFPCQEPPGAMATWQAVIHAPKEFMVIMSGDEEGRVLQNEDGLVSTLHYTDMLQPSSIVTLAIGKWRCYNVPVPEPEEGWQSNKNHLFSMIENDAEAKSPNSRTQCNHDDWPCRIGCSYQPIIPSRIIAPLSILKPAVKEFSSYLPRCLHAVFSLLGPHPFSRLDVLILPRCFASLGLASPSLIFLSQSLLSGDGSFLPRLAHEISHSWFGILIGTRDWTEEWLSEGFATFMEDPIHALSQDWTSKQYHDHSRLKGLLRYKALKSELENTESELQIMRPMAGGSGSMDDACCGGNVDFVRNGLNPDKWFLQVHYLKGYFLLYHIASCLSMEKVLNFINTYVIRYHGQLVLSKDIFQLLFDEYPEIKDKGVTMETIYSDWLDKAGMPQDLNPESYSQENSLISTVMTEIKKWKEHDKFHQKATKSAKKKKRRKIRSSKFNDHSFLRLSSDQLILLLEGLLDMETMATQTLDDLESSYHLRKQNAEVRHRWCELVVKHKFKKGYTDVRHFLVEDQAMGVYLYGELMASEDPVQQDLARDCFKCVAMEIDRGCYRTVHEMVYGEPAERLDT